MWAPLVKGYFGELSNVSVESECDCADDCDDDGGEMTLSVMEGDVSIYTEYLSAPAYVRRSKLECPKFPIVAKGSNKSHLLLFR